MSTSIAELAATLKLDTSQFKTGIEEAKTQGAGLGSSLGGVSTHAAGLDEAGSKAEALGGKLEGAGTKAGGLGTALGGLSSGGAGLGPATDKAEALETHLGAATEKGNGLASALGGIGGKGGGLSDAEASAKSLGSELEGAGSKAEGLGGKLGGLGGAIGPVIALAAPLVGAFEFKEAISSVTELGDQVRTMGLKTGMSAEDSSRLLLALKDVGPGADAGTAAMGKLAKSLEASQLSIEANKPDKLAQRLDELGIAIDGQDGKLLPMKDLLGNVADQFQKMPDGPEKTALAMQLFGKAGASMIGMLNLGRDGLKEFADESDKMGTTLSGPTVESVHKLELAQKAFGTAMEGVQVAIGTMLLPVMMRMATGATELAVGFNTNVLPALEKFGAVISTVLAPVGQLIDHLHLGGPILAAFGVAAGTVLVAAFTAWAIAAGTAAVATIAATWPILAIVAGIALLAVGIGELVSHWGDLEKKFPILQALTDAVKTEILGLVGAFQAVSGVVIHLGDDFENLGTAVHDKVSALGSWLTDHWQQIVTGVLAVIFPPGAGLFLIVTHWQEIKDKIGGIVDGIKSDLTAKWDAIKDAISPKLDAIQTVFDKAMNVLKVGLGKLWDDIKDSIFVKKLEEIKQAVSDKWDALKTMLEDKWTSFKDWWGEKWDDLKTFFGDKLTAIEDAFFTGWWDDLKNSVFVTKLGELKDTLVSAWTAAKDAATTAWEAIKGAVSDKVTALLDLVKSIPGKITDALGNLKDLLVSAGEDLIGGLIKGIGNKLGELKDTVSKDISSAIPDWVKAAWKTGSPSQLAADELGEPFMLGIAAGIVAGKTALTKALDDAINAAVDSGKDAATAGAKAIGDAMASSLTSSINDAVARGRSALSNVLQPPSQPQYGVVGQNNPYIAQPIPGFFQNPLQPPMFPPGFGGTPVIIPPSQPPGTSTPAQSQNINLYLPGVGLIAQGVGTGLYHADLLRPGLV